MKSSVLTLENTSCPGGYVIWAAGSGSGAERNGVGWRCECEVISTETHGGMVHDNAREGV